MRILLVLLACTFALPAMADEKPVRLKQASGLEKVEGNCAACHSLDYILMNSPFPNAALWDAEVNKMIRFLPKGCLTERLQQCSRRVKRRRANRRLSGSLRRHDGRPPRAGCRVGVGHRVDDGSGCWRGARTAVCERTGTGAQPRRLWS